MLYPRNAGHELSDELFLNPTAEYRGAPFWSWNTRLSEELVLPQIDQFQEMGMGGFHIHCRSGLATEYLSDEFMGLIRACNERAKQRSMLCWLYDEDRWPSGAAGGLVTRDPAYRMRYLVFTPWPYGDSRAPAPRKPEELRGAMIDRNGKGRLLARFEIRLEKGLLADYRLLAEAEPARPGYRVWYAYIEMAATQPWYNNQAYVNTLSRDAIRRFVEVTHETYWKAVGADFGTSIPAIFSDEPQFAHKSVLSFAEEERDLIIPYTDDFEESFSGAYGVGFLSSLPQLFWEGEPDSTRLLRYRYHDHVAERFSSAFADTIGDWCAEHGIMLTGHMMEEPTLESQTTALGEAMRSYRSFQLPGIDMLCDRREFNTAKQAQSAARQLGAPGVLSELYGVTGWHFDFRGHKLQGDWQAALGVTVRVHHLSWLSMEGEAKRDYPAAIGFQSPWFREYRMVEDHFARLNTVLTRGTAVARIAVVHPIESYWLAWGPREQTALERDELDGAFSTLSDWLLFGQLDFDFLAESLLQGRAEVKDGRLAVGPMRYEAIIVSGCRTLRATTFELLERFSEAGGTLIFIGEPPRYISAAESPAPRRLADRSIRVPMARAAILRALEPFRDVEVRGSDGRLHDNLIYQLRADGNRHWLFLCHVHAPRNPDLPAAETVSLRLTGSYAVTFYDTMDGSHRSLETRTGDGHSELSFELACHDSVLLALDPPSTVAEDMMAKTEATPRTRRGSAVSQAALLANLRNPRRLGGPVDIELSEPNVLLLDRAEYRFSSEAPWYPVEEILRIDNAFRTSLGWPARTGRMAQPWVEPDDASSRRPLTLRFRIQSELALVGVRLALEQAASAQIRFNGQPVESRPTGWFVDKPIGTVELPTVPGGVSVLEVTIPVTRRSGAEWMYLLGDFGVEVAGTHACLVAPVRRLSFGDWTTQGLPFYGGNVTYRIPVQESGHRFLQAAHFRNPLLSVQIDGRAAGRIAFSPYVADLGTLDAGEHLVELTAYGNRANTFGPVHNANDTLEWWGPDSWRTTGWSWSDEYRLRKTGVLVAPWLLDSY